MATKKAIDQAISQANTVAASKFYSHLNWFVNAHWKGVKSKADSYKKFMSANQRLLKAGYNHDVLGYVGLVMISARINAISLISCLVTCSGAMMLLMLLTSDSRYLNRSGCFRLSMTQIGCTGALVTGWSASVPGRLFTAGEL